MPPNFIPGKGRISTDLYDFKKHTDGYDFNHNAIDIILDNPNVLFGNPNNVQEALINLSNYANSDSEQTFLTLGDGYDTWHNADGNNNFDQTIPSLDTLLNPIFNAIINDTELPLIYKRIKNGGVIVLKAGTYIVKNSINVPAGITIMGEGASTKVINGTNLDFNYYPPRRKTLGTPNPVFIIKQNNNRDFSSDKQNINDDSSLFMFQTCTKLINFIISDNFTEEPVLGDNYWTLPCNISGFKPLILQENCSNLEMYGVYLIGKSLFGNTFPNPAIISTYYAIGLDTSVSNLVYPQTILKMNNCFIDNFAQPIHFNGINSGSDILEVSNCKIRGFGYALGDGSLPIHNAIFNVNNNTIHMNNNIIHNKGVAYILIHYTDKFNPINTENGNSIISSNIIKGIFAETAFNSPIYYAGLNTEDNTPIIMFGNFSSSGFMINKGPIIKNGIKNVGVTYSVFASDSVILVSGTANKTITIPTSVTMGQELIIKDASGNASIYPISVNCIAGIDGLSSFTINQNYGSITLIGKDSAGWLII